jgi:hypothetical protein
VSEQYISGRAGGRQWLYIDSQQVPRMFWHMHFVIYRDIEMNMDGGFINTMCNIYTVEDIYCSMCSRSGKYPAQQT